MKVWSETTEKGRETRENDQLFQARDPEQLRAKTPQFFNSLLKPNMNFTKHTMIIQHTNTHTTANAGGGARHNSCPH